MQTPRDELAEIRAEIRRLEARAANLRQAAQVRRPGWPMQRLDPTPEKPLH